MIAEIQFKNAQKAAALRHGIAMRKHLIHGGSEGDLEVRHTRVFLRPLPRVSVWLCLPGVCLVSLRLGGAATAWGVRAFRSLIAWLLLSAQTCTCWQNEESDSGDDTDDDW